MVNYMEDLQNSPDRQDQEITRETSKGTDLHNLDIKHNSTVGTEVLLVHEGEVRTGAYSAQELEQKLNDFNKYILAHYPANLRTAMSASFGIRTDGTYKSTKGDDQTWAEHNFQYVPLFAIVSNLSKWQMEVRQMETQLLMYHGSSPQPQTRQAEGSETQPRHFRRGFFYFDHGKTSHGNGTSVARVANRGRSKLL